MVYQQSSVSLKLKYANLVEPMQTQFQATTPIHVVLKYKIRKHHEFLISIYKETTVIYSSVKSVLRSIPTANFI